MKNVLTTAEEEKKRKYVITAEACHGSFSPFVVTVDGALGPEAVLFLQRLAEKLSVRWERGYGGYWGGLRHDFPLLLSGLLICVCGDHVCNGDLARVLMMELASLMLCLCSTSDSLIDFMEGLQMMINHYNLQIFALLKNVLGLKISENFYPMRQNFLSYVYRTKDF